MTKLPDDMPKLDEILIKTDSVPWREKSLKGVHEKMLWRNDETGASIALIKFDKGAGIPQPHYHSSNQFMFCSAGPLRMHLDRRRAHAGSFYCNPKGNVHGRRSPTRKPSWSRSMTARTSLRRHPGTPTSGTRTSIPVRSPQRRVGRRRGPGTRPRFPDARRAIQRNAPGADGGTARYEIVLAR